MTPKTEESDIRVRGSQAHSSPTANNAGTIGLRKVVGQLATPRRRHTDREHSKTLRPLGNKHPSLSLKLDLKSEHVGLSRNHPGFAHVVDATTQFRNA